MAVIRSVGLHHVSVLDEMDGVGSIWCGVLLWLHSSLSKASNFVGGSLLDPFFAVGSNY